MNNINNNEIKLIPELNFLFNKQEKNKKVNSIRKGKNFERFIAKDLEKKFSESFRRVPCSGGLVGGSLNFYKNKDLNTEIKNALTGDIICPSWFPFVIEVKCHYNTPKFHLFMEPNGDSTFNRWIEQAEKESKIANKNWLIIFKVTATKGNIFCACNNSFIKNENEKILNNFNYIKYKDVYIFSYEEFWKLFKTIIKL